MSEVKLVEETAKSGITILTEMPKISIKAEIIFHLFGFGITNSMIASAIVFLLTIFIAFKVPKLRNYQSPKFNV